MVMSTYFLSKDLVHHPSDSQPLRIVDVWGSRQQSLHGKKQHFIISFIQASITQTLDLSQRKENAVRKHFDSWIVSNQLTSCIYGVCYLEIYHTITKQKVHHSWIGKYAWLRFRKISWTRIFQPSHFARACYVRHENKYFPYWLFSRHP